MSRNQPYERIAGVPGQSLEPLGTCEDTTGTPLGRPRNSPGTPAHAPGTPRRRPWDVQGTQGTATNHKDGYTSTTCQGQEPLIAASESFCCNASSQILPLIVLSCIRREPSPSWSATGPSRGRPKASGEGGCPGEKGVCP